jgi:hypothetical protein
MRSSASSPPPSPGWDPEPPAAVPGVVGAVQGRQEDRPELIGVECLLPVLSRISDPAAVVSADRLHRLSRTISAGSKQSMVQVDAGGWGGIRTHEELAPLPVFKTGALNRSATHPLTKTGI